MQIYTIKNKSENETDFIINILDNERIPYKLKPIKQQVSFFEPPVIIGYDIELHTDLQHYEYFNRILQKEQNKRGLYCVKMPPKIQVQPYIPFTMLMMMSLSSPLNNFDKEQGQQEQKQKNKKVKKSMLKKLTDWIRGID